MRTPVSIPAETVAKTAREGRALQKGQATKAAIVDAALGLATQIGLEGLSIGALAEVMGMSKSGVFAHFGSREELQISVVREYHQRFEGEVFYPALQAPRGLPRLQALFANWMKRTSVELDSGCLYISGAVEFDDRPGPVRDTLVSSGRHRPRSNVVRDPWPDSGPALRGALFEDPRLHSPRAARLRAHRCALPGWQPVTTGHQRGT
jgi:AcrR family transcriptional regulator